MPCYNQSPEQCRPFFFVPCAFFNSAYAHFSLLGFPERFIPPSAGKVLVGPARAHPESVWSPHGKALGAGGASRSGSFVQKFYGKSYAEAMTMLLGSSAGPAYPQALQWLAEDRIKMDDDGRSLHLLPGSRPLAAPAPGVLVSPPLEEGF